MIEFINWVINAGNSFIDFLTLVFYWLFGWVFRLAEWLGETINWILTGLWDFFSAIGAFIAAFLDFLGLMIQTALEVIEILIMVLGIVFDFMRIVAAWIGQFIALVFATIENFNTATPIVLPGLPRCVSAPLEHNACAFYYFLENTLLADNTPGAIIITIIVLIIDLWILFYVYKTLLGMGKMMMEIFR